MTLGLRENEVAYLIGQVVNPETVADQLQGLVGRQPVERDERLGT